MVSSGYDMLAAVEPFSRLEAGVRADIAARFAPREVARGELLIREGERSADLFIVASGRFTILNARTGGPVAEITAGQLVGEITFFAGGLRTASVRADRDSVVLALSRAAFDDLAAQIPELWPTVARTLAVRLADTTSGRWRPRAAAPRTIAVVGAGSHAVVPGFVAALHDRISGRRDSVVLDADAARRLPGLTDDDASVRIAQFNDLEKQYRQMVFVCDDRLSDWTRKALRQADLVLLVARADDSDGATRPNPIERMAAALHEPRNIRILLIHPRRRQRVDGTAKWLDARPFAGMHHHVTLSGPDDLERVFRFIEGRATGLVASGGGALTAAHIGAQEALEEAGYDFDIFGGTSGGAAMAAAFAGGVTGERLDSLTHEMFVVRQAMGRWNWPRYSLLDHRVFDELLISNFGEQDVADLWMPYFAVATNLTKNRVEILRRGPLWQAVRASAAIPALFPPVFRDGDMLVDGCLSDNVPVAAMRAIKSGPNVILDLDVPGLPACSSDTSRLPSRWSLVKGEVIGRLGGGALADDAVPGPHAVLLGSLMRQGRQDGAPLADGDLLLSFPVPEWANVLDWSRHRELREAARAFTAARLEDLAEGR